MENKCNKTPNSNNKYLDHVYCHTSESKNYIRANINGGNGGAGGAATGSDLLALLKENKQLKAMLILHLDLIQEQSEQIASKDKQINSQIEVAASQNTKIAQLEAQIEDLQRQLQRQIKRTAAAAGEFSSLPPPPLAKIQRKADPVKVSTTNNVIGECNGKLISKIILHRVNLPEAERAGTCSPNSTSGSETNSETLLENEEHGDVEETTGHSTEDSNDTTSSRTKFQRHKTPLSLIASRGAKPRRLLIGKTPPASSATPVQVCITPPTPSRGKQMPLMLWHAPDMHSDESASCDSMADTEQRSSVTTSPASIKISSVKKKISNSILAPPEQHLQQQKKVYITTPQMYCAREWEDEEFLCENDFMKDESDVLNSDEAAPMLEVPKWTEHEFTVSYCIEGTEDLCDDTFLKRHAKLEVDERRRKKWDVQQIREQRRIEKLKRRHCKNEIQQAPSELEQLNSFYPQPDAVKMICYVNDVPVQAFGEMIPKLNINSDFDLPWLETTTGSSTHATVEILDSAYSNVSSAQGQQQLLHSSFVFLKKRRRRQSLSTGAALTARLRRATMYEVTPSDALTLVNEISK